MSSFKVYESLPEVNLENLSEFVILEFWELERHDGEIRMEDGGAPRKGSRLHLQQKKTKRDFVSFYRTRSLNHIIGDTNCAR